MAERTCVLSGAVRGGKLKIRGWQGVQDWRDGEITITIARKRATRSQLQNAWYFGVILRLLSEHTGYTVDEMHDYCKVRFNGETLLLQDANGVVVDEQRIGQSTAKLGKNDFGEYCEQIRQWAAVDLGVLIPDPDVDWRTVGAERSEVA